MKRFFFATLTATLLLTGCYKDDLWQMHKELHTLSDRTLASLSEQAQNMEKSIADLNELNETLQEFIEILGESGIEVAQELIELQQKIEDFRTASEGQIDANKADFLLRIDALNDAVMTEVNTFTALVSSLDSDGDELKQKIEVLKLYLDNVTEKEWVNATFATLEMQNYLISVLAASKAKVNAFDKVAAEIDSALMHKVDSAFAEFSGAFPSELSSRAEEFTSTYTAALSQLEAKLKAANADTVALRIAENEASVKAWINGELDDYYKLADYNEQCRIFDIILGTLPEGKDSFQQELDELDKAIGDARTSVTAAYEKAIKDAIEKHEGEISEKMATEIGKLRTDVIDPINGRLSTVSSDIGQLKNDVTALDNKIKTVEAQREAISGSIKVLTDLKVTLEQYVSAVRTELRNKDISDSSALKGMIDKLDALVKGTDPTSLPSQIAALNDYIGTLPEGKTDVSTWISSTLETFSKQKETIALIEDVDVIFNAFRSTLGTDDGNIKALEDGLDKLLENNEAKIKGWISTKLQGYYKTGEIEGKLTALEEEILALYTKGDQVIQDRIDSLSGDLDDKKKELKAAYEEAVDTTIRNHKAIVNGRITSDFADVDASISAIGTKAASLENVVDSLRKDLTKYMKRVEVLKDSLSTLEAFLSVKNSEDETYKGILEMVHDLNSKINNLEKVFDKKEDFEAVNAYITDTLSQEAAKVSGLVTRLEAVEATLSNIKSFVSDFDTTGTSLHDQVGAISDSIDSLKRYVNGVDSLGIKSYSAQIDSVMKALYGEGKDPATPASGSIVAKLNSLNAKIGAKHVSSITYVPRYLDQTESVYKVGDRAVAMFRFIVKPAGSAEYVSRNLKMKYKPIDGNASSLKEYNKDAVTVDGDAIEVTVSATASEILDNNGKPKVCSALFFNYSDGGETLSSYTSKFIFFSVDEDKSSGKIPSDNILLRFPKEGGSATATIGASNLTLANEQVYWLIRKLPELDLSKFGWDIAALAEAIAYNGFIGIANDVNESNGLIHPGWVTVDPEYTTEYAHIRYPYISYYEGVNNVRVSVEENTDGKERSCKLVFRIVFKDIADFVNSATGEKDLIIYIIQEG